jgi:ElaB/YqjD/DUF883 family membrane-anchored ribosome-binding protein
MNSEWNAGADNNSVKDATEQTAKDFDTLRQDIANLTNTVADLIQHRAQAVRSQAAEALDAAKSTFAQSVTDAQDKVMSLESELESSIGRSPLTALVIAMGVGVAVGMMTQSRK